MAFHDREEELRLLDEIRDRKGAQFIVLYGRRRIGKTALILHWLERKPTSDWIYWVAHRSSPGLLLDKFSQAVKPCLQGVSEDVRFVDWEAAFRQVFSMAEKRRIVLAIDEFPYLAQSVPELPSLLQALWDRHGKESNLALLLCGSHYHMMHEEFLSGRGALYGRSTADILLEEMAPEGIHLFLPRYSPEQIVETYSIIGGTPKYLEMWDDRRPVLKNVQETVLSPATIFRQEAVYLIQDEIPEPRTYLAILEAIGSGRRRPVEIAERTGIVINHVGKYLHTLLALGFVRRRASVDAPDPRNTRMTRYEIKSPYLRFHFSYLQPHWSLLEQNRTKRLMEIIRQNHEAFVGRTGFEELARRHITRMGDAHELSFEPESVGSLWNKKAEIDVAAMDRRSKNVLLGECKWTNRTSGEAELERLMKRSEAFPRIRGYTKHYALFSKTGFTAGLRKKAAEGKVLLFRGASFERE